MVERRPRYPKEEFARRGRAIYEERIRPQVEPGEDGRIVAIDIETGEFAIADDVLQACERLIVGNPDVQIWTARVGHRAVHRIGAWDGPTTIE